MSETQNNTCIINAQSGIGTSSPQISRFTHNFDSIKFVIDKDFTNYAVVVITNISGNVNIISEGETLVKSYDAESKTTNLLWYPQCEVTAESGVVTYQIAAYDTDENKSIWYSKEGRLIVTESIETNDFSTELIGSSPNLVMQLITALKNMELMVQESENGVGKISDSVDDLSEEFNLYKGEVHTGESEYNPQSNLAQSGKAVAQAVANIINSAPETLDTLKELSDALGNDPNFATTIMTLLGNKVEKDTYNNDMDYHNQKFSDIEDDIYSHKDNANNPHRVTKEQVGLSDVDNTSDKDKPVSDAVARELNNKVDKVNGKGLSSNDFTDEDRQILADTRHDVNIMIDDIGNVKERLNTKVDKIDGKGLSTYDFNDEWAEKVDSAFWGVEEINKPPLTEIQTTLMADYEYSLGEVESLTLAFPTTASDGDVIYLTFKSGATPTALTIDTTNTCDIECIPEANTGYEIFGKYNGSIWIINYSEYTVSEG